MLSAVDATAAIIYLQTLPANDLTPVYFHTRFYSRGSTASIRTHVVGGVRSLQQILQLCFNEARVYQIKRNFFTLRINKDKNN